MKNDEAIRRSALWAAYGDALGFITELADLTQVRRRVGVERVDSLVSWSRRIGGRFGINVALPSGCYSDDTQLRLATSRAIRDNGDFDVEVFAKVELPVWRGYALGAGRGSKEAAQALAKGDVQWCSNFFSSKSSRYIDGGGNGAAMRIQPHVWCGSAAQRDSEIVRQIIRNSITTHGHPRGVLGAVFHGLCLRQSLQTGATLRQCEWLDVIEKLRYTTRIIRSDDELRTFWMPRWEMAAGRQIDEAFDETIGELLDDIQVLSSIRGGGDSAKKYLEAIEALGAFSISCRGSGTKTALLASFLATTFEGNALKGIQAASNALGSDTDSIATMAGALLGVNADSDPPEEVADIQYIQRESARMSQIGLGHQGTTFDYPDLLYWESPRAEIDVLGMRDDQWFVVGLGKARPIGETYEQGGRVPAIWQWFELDFGQRVLLKRRPAPTEITKERLPIERPTQGTSHNRSSEKRKGNAHLANSRLSVEEAAGAAIDSRFDPRVVGTMLLELADGQTGAQDAKDYAARIAEERRSGTGRR